MPHSDMRVKLHRGHLGMAEILLDGPHVDVRTHEVRGDRMAETVGRHLLVTPAALQILAIDARRSTIGFRSSEGVVVRELKKM